MKKSISLEVLLPVYNEELRIENGVVTTVEYLSERYDGFVITIVDNGSNDRTQSIAEDLVKRYSCVQYLRLNKKGVGIAFREGVKQSRADYIGYMDIDLSTDINHLEEVIDIFSSESDVDLINASRLNKKSQTVGRKWYRNITSHGLTLMLKIFLGLRATDSICGFKFFKMQSVRQLIKESRENVDGWFFIIELLLRAERDGMQIVELPVRWEDELHSTVNVPKLIMNYCKEIVALRRVFNQEKKNENCNI